MSARAVEAFNAPVPIQMVTAVYVKTDKAEWVTVEIPPKFQVPKLCEQALPARRDWLAHDYATARVARSGRRWMATSDVFPTHATFVATLKDDGRGLEGGAGGGR